MAKLLSVLGYKVTVCDIHSVVGETVLVMQVLSATG